MTIKYVSVEESRAGSKSESPKSPKPASDKSVTSAVSTKPVGGSPASSPEED